MLLFSVPQFSHLRGLNLDLANTLNSQLNSMASLHVMAANLKCDEVEADGTPVLAEPPDPEGFADFVVGTLAAGDDFALVGGGDNDAGNGREEPRVRHGVC